MSFIPQPDTTTISCIAARLDEAPVSLQAAVAYATFSGVRLLLEETRIAARTACEKRFLVGIDWFRSEPAALNTLQALKKSKVRIVDGEFLLTQNNCQPRRTFHPKAYAINGTSQTLIVGSANLSANGLKSSIELSLATDDVKSISDFETWFEAQWRRATPWASIRDEYSRKYESAKSHEFVVTEDDDVPDPRVFGIRWVTPDRLRLLRAAQNLWVDVGTLHNRDKQGLPGTDLQFSQMTRIFFGGPLVAFDQAEPLGLVDLTMAGARRANACEMYFNIHSSMDRLSLPIPGELGWPPKYDGETLLFTKAGDGSFFVTMASGRDRVNWKRASERNGFWLPMQRGRREWGVF